MRIAQVAPLFERVPPQTYGGTERVVAYLTDALVALGHDVTLFASADSQTAGRLWPSAPRAVRLDPACRDSLSLHIRQLELVARRAGEFDIIHFHTGFLHMPVARRLTTPSVTTCHGRLDLPETRLLMQELRDVPVVSISHAQRQPIESLNWRGTVYHGLPPDLLRFQPADEGYLAFVGRISPEKRVDRAIAIATCTGIPLRIAAKVDAADRDYFHATIEPLLQHRGVTFLGEVDEQEKARLLGGARALLFPIDWPEPFGMVVIEALSCGTPIIAWNRGSVPELIEDGVTGFVVEDVESAIEAVSRLETIDRATCRAVFERRFVAERMARDYVAIYKTLTESRRHGRMEAMNA